MQVLSVIVPYIKTTSNIWISCKSLRDWLSNNGFAIKSSEVDLCLENLSFYKLLDYPNLDKWTMGEFYKAIKAADCNHLLSLLQGGANIEAKDNHGSTALISAAMYYQTKCLKLLLQHKANIEAKDNYGKTALMRAVWEDNVECPNLLLEHKANIEAKDNHGETALICVARYKKVNCLKLLLQSGAQVDHEMRQRFPQYAELWEEFCL